MRKAAMAATAMLVLPVLGSSAVSATDTGIVTQLTDGNNKSTVPVVDSSGTKVVFHSLATDFASGVGYSGVENLFVTDTVADTFEQIVIDGIFPDLSPNGQWVVYTMPYVDSDGDPSNDQPNQVWLERTDGSIQPIEVTAGGNANSGTFQNRPGVRVANNGTVVFQSLASNLVAGDTDDGEWDVFSYSQASGVTTKLSTGDDVDYLHPDISGDASTVAYQRDTGTDRSVYTNTPTGGSETLRAGGNGISELPRLDDDGSKMVFRSDSTDLVAGSSTTFNTYVWSASGIERVTNFNGGPVTSPDISGDGAFVTYARSAEIWRSAATTGGATIQVSDFGTNATFINYPAIDGDGSVITYAQSVPSSSTNTVDVQVMLWDEDASVPEPPPEPEAPKYCSFSDPILKNAPYAGMSGSDARIARLYAAYFLREPDAPGFKFWQDVIAAGAWTNERAASFFGESPEFKKRYGANLSDVEFLTQVYNNVMCREPDEGGLAFWLGRMDDGWSRGKVALFFSDSPEFRTRTKTT